MGFYKSGNVVKEKRKIIINYFKAEFWYDFIPTISLMITEESGKFMFVVYFEILRIF